MPLHTLTDHPPDQPLPWSEGYAVGIAYLDEEHRAMLMACNHLCAMVARGARHATLRVLSLELVATVEAHFATEERLFPHIGFPWVAQHLLEHELIRNRLGLALLRSCPPDAGRHHPCNPHHADGTHPAPRHALSRLGARRGLRARRPPGAQGSHETKHPPLLPGAGELFASAGNIIPRIPYGPWRNRRPPAIPRSRSGSRDRRWWPAS